MRQILELPAKSCPEVRVWRRGKVWVGVDCGDCGREVLVALLPMPPASSFPPQVLLLGFASVPGEWGMLPREVLGALLPTFLDNANANSSVVLRSLWATNQVCICVCVCVFIGRWDWTGRGLRSLPACCKGWQLCEPNLKYICAADAPLLNLPPPSSTFLQGLVLEILVEYYSQDHAHIARVLDICLELQV